MYKTMMEARKPIKIVARLFLADGQWAVRPGAMVVYAKESISPVLCLTIETGETRPSQAAIVEWLEEKARRGVKEALHLDEQEASKLVIESEIKIE